MPEQQFIAPIRGIQINSSEEASLAILLKCSLTPDPEWTCPRCLAKAFRTKAYVVRQLKHAVWSGKLVLLHLKVPKLQCLTCQRFFMAPIPGVLPKRRATEQFRQDVFHLHQGGLTQKNLSITHQIGTATVERWYQDFVANRVKELEARSCPTILGIDEHFFSRKDGYATTFVDLKNHKVFDVVLGRSEASLKSFLQRLPGRENVRVIVMDLSETYRSIAKKYFPNAMIVADRFHVIRLLNHHFLKLWQTFDSEGRKNRGLLSLMRRHEWNLTPEQRAKLNLYFEKIPGLRFVYEFKQDLARLLLLKSLKRRHAKEKVPQLLWHLNECLQSTWPPLHSFGETLKSWLEPIVRMWRFRKTNGITEGLHNKMEMISRRAFGFRSFKNYRLRVIALCGWNGVFGLRNISGSKANRPT
jgi:transposase